jgi:hypothetical protein
MATPEITLLDDRPCAWCGSCSEVFWSGYYQRFNRNIVAMTFPFDEGTCTSCRRLRAGLGYNKDSPTDDLPL